MIVYLMPSLPPFKLLPIVLAFLAVTLYFEIDSTLGLYFKKLIIL